MRVDSELQDLVIQSVQVLVSLNLFYFRPQSKNSSKLFDLQEKLALHGGLNRSQTLSSQLNYEDSVKLESDESVKVLKKRNTFA